TVLAVLLSSVLIYGTFSRERVRDASRKELWRLQRRTWIERPSRRVAQRSTATPRMAWLAGITCLLVLAGCGGETATGSSPPTPTPVPTRTTASPSPTASSSDWTTYHHDNLRTGYIASTPDP